MFKFQQKAGDGLRRILTVFLCIFTIFTLTVTVSATSATNVTSYTVVDNKGNCQVTIHAQLQLEQSVKDLNFPVPIEATDIILNGGQARTRMYSDAQHVDLSSVVGGDEDSVSFTIVYTLKNVVGKSEAGAPQIRIPLLSGFDYPIESLEFSVSIPGQIQAKPAFISGYHQASIEESLSTTVSGNMVSGHSLKNLKDHETLFMTLEVSDGMFPAPPVPLESALFDDIGMITCAALALIYWLLTLRSKPLHSEKTDLPPVGFTAGELNSILTLQGANLTMMVLNWAQLGYILIQMDRNKRVFLHKRMEMGNERSAFEQRCFKNLFAGKSTVDTSGYRYAMLCKKMEVLSPNVRPLIQRKTGSFRVFRLLCAGVGLFGGMSMGFSLVSSTGWQWFWAIVLAILGSLSAWQIQNWATYLIGARKQVLTTAIYLCIPWVLLALPGSNLLVGILVPLCQLMGGLMATFGGRRTDEGYQAAKQVLGLRKYLKSLKATDLERIMETDPDYFHELAPYAIALGVGKPFAQAFGKQGIAACPYLTTGMDGHRPAMEWCNLMSEAVESMDRRQKQMTMEKMQKLISTIRK